MLIWVKYSDGSEGMVESTHLDEIISAGKINNIRRSDGWINVATAHLRGAIKSAYAGQERRRDRLQFTHPRW